VATSVDQSQHKRDDLQHQVTSAKPTSDPETLWLMRLAITQSDNAAAMGHEHSHRSGGPVLGRALAHWRIGASAHRRIGATMLIADP
jgi:hypothetical protein